MWIVLICVTTCLAIVAALEIGRRIGKTRLQRDPNSSAGTGAIDGAIFGLMGLLVAFTFSGAATRFDARRSLILEEANIIGTAYLRLDLLPAEPQMQLKQDFRQYVDSRLAAYRAVPDMDLVNAELKKSGEIQSRIWSRAVAATKELNSPPVTTLLLSVLNDMIDITQTRLTATQTHPPYVVFVVLIVMILAAAGLAGHNMSAAVARNWIYIITFAGLMTLALYLILDLEFPRLGLIRVDSFDQLLVDVRNSMK